MQLEILWARDDSLPLLALVDGEMICLRGTSGAALSSEGIRVQWSLTGDQLSIQAGSKIRVYDLSQLSLMEESLLRRQLTSFLSFNVHPELMACLCPDGPNQGKTLLSGLKKDDQSYVEHSLE